MVLIDPNERKRYSVQNAWPLQFSGYVSGCDRKAYFFYIRVVPPYNIFKHILVILLYFFFFLMWWLLKLYNFILQTYIVLKQFRQHKM